MASPATYLQALDSLYRWNVEASEAGDSHLLMPIRQQMLSEAERLTVELEEAVKRGDVRLKLILDTLRYSPSKAHNSTHNSTS